VRAQQRLDGEMVCRERVKGQMDGLKRKRNNLEKVEGREGKLQSGEEHCWSRDYMTSRM
jgi:hypothetical protein